MHLMWCVWQPRRDWFLTLPRSSWRSSGPGCVSEQQRTTPDMLDWSLVTALVGFFLLLAHLNLSSTCPNMQKWRKHPPREAWHERAKSLTSEKSSVWGGVITEGCCTCDKIFLCYWKSVSQFLSFPFSWQLNRLLAVSWCLFLIKVTKLVFTFLFWVWAPVALSLAFSHPTLLSLASLCLLPLGPNSSKPPATHLSGWVGRHVQ